MKKQTVWKGCVSLPPDCVKFLQTQGPNRSAAIVAAIVESKKFKLWLKRGKG